MRTYRGWVAGIVLAAVVGGAAVPQEPTPAAKTFTPEQQTRLKERSRLWQEAIEAEKGGRWKEAVGSREKALTITREVYGPKSPPVATSLGVNAKLYLRLEDWSTARAARAEAAGILAALYGKDDWRVTNARIDLADVGLYQKMTPEDRTAARRAEGLLADGARLQAQGKTADARNRYLQALEIRRRVLGERHPDSATPLTKLGGLHRAAGEYAQAESRYTQAAAIWKETLGERHPDYAATLGNLGVTYHRMGQHHKAEPLLKQSVDITRAVRGEDHPDYAIRLSNLAMLYRDMSEYGKAEPLLKRSLALLRKARGDQHPDYAVALNNLAMLYRDAGDPAKAEPLFRQSLELRRKVQGENHPAYATALNNLALFYWDTQEYAKAEPLFSQALEIRRVALGAAHPDYAASLSNLAQTYARMGRYTMAEPLLKEALKLDRKSPGPSHPAFAMSLNNLAVLYQDAGEHAKAEPYLRQAADVLRAALGEDHPSYALALGNLAMLYRNMSQYAKAEPLLRQALAIRRKTLGPAHPLTAESAINLAVVYLDAGEPAKAAPLFRDALAARLDLLDKTADVQTELSQVAFAQNLLGTLAGYLTATAADTGRLPADAYALALRWKGQVFVRQRRQRELARASADPRTAALAADLLDTTRQLAALAGQTPAPDKAPDLTARVASLAARRDQLETDLARVSAGFRRQRERETVTPDRLGRLFPAKTVLVDFHVYDHFLSGPKDGGKVKEVREARLVAFVVRPGGEVARVELGPFAPIREAVESWRKDTKRRRPVRKNADGDDDPDDPAVVLRDKLWLPVAKHLGGAETVLISPDADLARLPFAALPGSKAGTYLIEELAVAVLPVPQFLPDVVAPAAAGSPSLLVVGDVDYGADPGAPVPGSVSRAAVRGDRGGGWKQLPATREELASIRGAFETALPGGAVRALRQGEPTEGAVRDLLGKHRWIHLATHGFFADPEAKAAAGGARGRPAGLLPGLLSGVVLAGANRPLDPLSGADDGILTAEEIRTLDLRGTETVVLSACETGLGKTESSEGVLGLQRAFQVAGCRTTVTSLWTVDDEATRALMERAYRNWWGGKASKLEGLIEAQRWMLKEGVPGGGKGKAPPFYWAAFVLAGDWR